MSKRRHSRRSAGDPPRLKVDVSTCQDASLYGPGVAGPPDVLGQAAQLGDYALLKEIGSGGMGVVFLARNSLKPGEEKVALKRIHPKLDGDRDVAARFIKEIRAIQAVQHPYIVEILDVSDDPDQPYYVMPFYERGSLADLIREQGPLKPDEAVRFAAQLAAALDFAHKRDRRHGDVKPVNLLLDNGGRTIRLADFGLARDFSIGADVAAVFQRPRCGTAPYMSPGMVEGKGEGLQADIYMFGATLYEMLTGRPPYEGDPNCDLHERALDIYRKILAGPPEPIQRLSPDVPPWLAWIVEKAMDHDREARYATMEAVLRDLNAGAPEVSAPPASDTAADAEQPQHRRRMAVAAIVAVASLMVVLGLWHVAGQRSNGDTDALPEVRSIQVPGIRLWNSALPGDWDGDGVIDLYVAQDDRLVVVSTDGEVLAEHRLAEEHDGTPSVVLVDDLDGDGRDEAFLNWAFDTETFIDVVTQNQFETRRFTCPGATISATLGVRHPSALIPIALHDLTGNGRPELVALSLAGFHKGPRGVRCFDTETDELLWSYRTAVNPQETVIGDVTRNGEPEIVAGSYAHSNGVVLEDGTSDDHSYLYMLDRRGQLCWRREFGGEFSSARPALADLDEDGELDLIVVATAQRSYRPDEEEYGCIHRLDSEGQTVNSYELGAEIHATRIARLTANGPVQIILADRLGRVHLFDPDFSLRRSVQLVDPTDRDVMTRIQAVEDLESDGCQEVIVSTWEVERRISPVSGRGEVTFTHNHTVFVLDAELTIRARRQLYDRRKRLPGWRVIPSDVNDDGRKELLVLTDEARVLAMGE